MANNLTGRPSAMAPPVQSPLQRSAQASHSQSGGGLTPRAFFQILRKRKWLILVCLLFFTGVSIVATLLWARYAPMFTAKAYLQVQPSERRIGYDMPAIEGAGGPNMDRPIRTHAELIIVDPVLKRALAEPDVQQTAWYMQAPLSAPLRLRDILTVTPVRDTSLILIKVTTTNANTAAILATAVGRAYELDNQEATKRKFDEHLNRLEQQRTRLETTANTLSENISRMAGTSAMQEQQNKWGVLVRELTMQELELVGLLRMALASYNRLLELQEQQALSEANEVMAILAVDPSYGQLLRESVQATNNLRFLLQNYHDDHPAVIDARQRVQMVEQELAQREKQATEGVVAESRMRQDSLSENLEIVRDDREMAVIKLRQINANISELNAQRDKLQEIIKELADVTNSINQTRISQEREQPVFLRQRAQPPEERSQPKWSLMVPGGVVLGLLVGLGLAMLLEAVDTSIKRPSDIERRIDLPLLGIIPHASDLEEDIDDLYHALHTHPDSPFGEAFRQIRTRLVFSGPVSEQRSLLITSPSPEDGRTVVAANLGAVMAQAGSRVLIVDANFRQPMLDQIFPGCPTDGLTNALIHQRDWRDLVYEVEPNMHVMSSGPLPPNPAELLGSDHMRQLIEEMSQVYDRVLFDSGPCLVVSDPCILAMLVEGVILTVRAGVNSQGIAQRARNTINEAGGRILGVTLNGVRAMPGGYLRKNYETFYEYRERQSLPSG